MRGEGKKKRGTFAFWSLLFPALQLKGRERESEGREEEWLHFKNSLYSTGPSSKYEAHRQPNHLRITGLMTFSAPVSCKILGVS